MDTKDNLHFKIGDIIIDTINNDVGILIRKYMLFDEFNDPLLYGDEEESTPQNILVWDIYWTGPHNLLEEEPLQTYTNDGLLILTETGVLKHFKNT